MSLLPWNAGQWVKCHGSVLMQTLYPTPPNASDEESENAKEGKAYHHVIAQILKAWQDRESPIPTMSSLIGQITPHGVVVDHTMAQAAIDYVTDTLKYINRNGSLRKMHVEERIDLSSIIGEGKYGVPDIWVWDAKLGELYIKDAKYGHRVVEAFENWQLIIYALALLDMLNVNGILDQHITVRLGIYQPRAYHVSGPSREWVIKASDLRGYRNQIDYAISAANSGEGKCVPGDHCRAYGCTAAHTCESLQRSAYNYIDYIGDALPVELDERSIGVEYLILKEGMERLKTRLTAIEQQCIGMIRNGTNIPGLATEQGYGRERWKKDVPTDEIILMGDLMGADIRKPVELDTPAQCRKKGIDDTVIKAYSETPNTQLKLVKDDGSKARQVFR